ncbi:MAG: branched-chain amino acid ABC transporter substrate-binding protein [Actinobacteria bacterium]|nr:branched-chain amino acid ABC transporter substrate-binding protein [Actinomycetota bacterium]
MNLLKSIRKRSAGAGIAVLVILIVLLSTLNLTACDTRERIIKIGNQAVLSGEYRSFGEDQLVSMELAISKISPVSIGGFDYKIEMVTKDDEGNPEKAFLVAREMIDQGAVAVIGSTFDGTTKVSIPVYGEYNIPIITPFAQKTDISAEGNNFFRMIINNRQKTENIADFIIDEIDPQRLILIDNREEYSNDLVDFMEELFYERGKEVLRRYSIKIGEDDVTVLAENLLIDEPDFIFFAGRYDELALMIKEVRKMGLGSRFITETLGMSESIFTLADSTDLEGTIAVIPEPPSLAVYSKDQRAVNFWHDYNEMLESIKEETPLSIEGPGEYAPYAYDAVFLVIEAMRRSNSTIPEDFMEELRTISFDGVAGNIQFDSNGNRLDPPSTIFIIKDGVWIRYN